MKKWMKYAGVLWCMGLVALLVWTKIESKDRVQATTITQEATASPEPTSTPSEEEMTSDDIANEISNVQDTKKALEEKKSALKDTISGLREKKGDLMVYIEELDKEVADLQTQIKAARKEVKQAKKELSQLQEDLVLAEENQKQQYDIMKQRIQYMYENGSQSYMGMVLSTNDLTEILNRVEYVSQISSYDKKIFKRYTETTRQIQEMETQVQQKLIEVQEKKDGLSIDKEYLEKMVDDKNTEMKKYARKLAKSKDKLSETEQEVARQEALVDELLTKQRKKIQEEMDKKAAAGNTEPGTNSNNPVITDGNNASGFRWPLVVAGTITSYFGYRQSPTAGASTYHRGVDIGADTGTQIVASKAGTVVTSTYQAAAGNYVAIYHGDATYSYYMHCSQLAVSEGEVVEQGQIIGYVGSTGVSTGPHLHFAIVIDGEYVDPLNYVSQK